MIIELKNIKNKYQLNDEESIYLIYKWITENIEYNCYNYAYDIKEYDEVNIYNKGIGLSYEISILFKKICQSLGIESDIIIGYSKLSSFTEGKIPSKTDHFWNYVKIDNNYYIIDASNGVGYCDGEIFMKYFKDFYFCPNPEYFNHLYHPVLNKWQLLPNIITLEEFVSKSLILDNFYGFGFTSINPDLSIMKVNEGKTNITLIYDNLHFNIKNMMVFCEIFYTNNNMPIQVPNSCLITKQNDKAIVNIIVNEKQEYILILLGGPIYSKVYTEFEEMLVCKINSTIKSINSLSFAGITPSYLFSEIEYFEPLYNLL